MTDTNTNPAANNPFADLVLKSRQITLPNSGVQLTVYAMPVGIVEMLLDKAVSAFAQANESENMFKMAAALVMDMFEQLVPVALMTDAQSGKDAKKNLDIKDGLALADAIVTAAFPGGFDDFLDYLRELGDRHGIEFALRGDEDTQTETTTPNTPSTSETSPIAPGTMVGLDGKPLPKES